MSDTLTADIQVESVETKSGEKNGRTWKLWRVHATDGTQYGTFDAALGSSAFGAAGRRAHITYKINDRDGRDLLSLEVDENSQPQAEPVRDQTENGAPDWDMIGLRKTRCALWVAAIGAGKDAAQARSLVTAAEVDIFHRQPADDLADIPF